jgi:hypothetical protein
MPPVSPRVFLHVGCVLGGVLDVIADGRRVNQQSIVMTLRPMFAGHIWVPYPEDDPVV